MHKNAMVVATDFSGNQHVYCRYSMAVSFRIYIHIFIYMYIHIHVFIHTHMPNCLRMQWSSLLTSLATCVSTAGTSVLVLIGASVREHIHACLVLAWPVNDVPTHVRDNFDAMRAQQSWSMR